MIVVGNAIARLAHMAAHSANRHEQLRNVLAAIAARGSEVVQQPHVLFLADFTCEPGNLVRRNAANLRGPLGIMLHAVVFALKVVKEVNVFLQVFGLMVGVKTDRVFVEEVPVDDIALGLIETNHFRSDAQQECRVGTSANRNPLGIKHLRRRGVNGVDGDEFDAGLLSANVVIARRTRGRPCRIRGIEHDRIGIEHVGTVVAHACVGVGNANRIGGVQKIGAMRGRVGGASVSAPRQKRRES